MPLSPGAHLGPYEVLGPIGAGGMGEVYRARDSRLGRDVAIKVLAADLVGSPEARQRFEREAKAAAALAHAHICRLLDVGRHGDTDYLVMELLEGETLASRLRRGKLPLRQALTYGTQIAGALVVAHRAGIVHRDLKPGNIMLTGDGAVLLDFGLARQTASTTMDAQTATLNDPITRTGVILGTVQYMSPEQLQGLPVDPRTDIFALGLVLYEMVTGRRAFEGSNHASLIANILQKDPAPLTTGDPLTPPALDRLVRKCLAKDPNERWATASDVVARLETLQDVSRDSIGSWSSAVVRLTEAWSTKAGLAIAAASLGVVGLAGWTWLAREHPTASLSVAPSQVDRHLTRLTFDPGLQTDPAFSPDGRFLAYASDKSGNLDIWVQPLAGGNALQITRSPSQDRLSTFGAYPSWSVDGSEVYVLKIDDFDAGGVSGLYAVSLAGDPPRQLLPEFTQRGDWVWIAPRADGRISFCGVDHVKGMGFFTVSNDGTVVTSKLTEEGPLALPNYGTGARLRFRWNAAGTTIYSESAGNSRSNVRNLWKITVDPSTLMWTSAQRLTASANIDEAAALSADDSKLAFSEGQQSERLYAFPFNSGGMKVGQGQPISESSRLPPGASLSPDGRNVAFRREGRS
jgi:eukaryotic-like serine/threonine-protein kinase